MTNLWLFSKIVNYSNALVHFFKNGPYCHWSAAPQFITQWALHFSFITMRNPLCNSIDSHHFIIVHIFQSFMNANEHLFCLIWTLVSTILQVMQYWYLLTHGDLLMQCTREAASLTFWLAHIDFPFELMIHVSFIFFCTCKHYIRSVSHFLFLLLHFYCMISIWFVYCFCYTICLCVFELLL